MRGYDVETVAAVSAAVSVPVIASGGAGSFVHMAEVLREGGASAVAAASMFHFTEQTPMEAKHYLASQGFPVHRVSRRPRAQRTKRDQVASRPLAARRPQRTVPTTVWTLRVVLATRSDQSVVRGRGAGADELTAPKHHRLRCALCSSTNVGSASRNVATTRSCCMSVRPAYRGRESSSAYRALGLGERCGCEPEPGVHGVAIDRHVVHLHADAGGAHRFEHRAPVLHPHGEQVIRVTRADRRFRRQLQLSVRQQIAVARRELVAAGDEALELARAATRRARTGCR